MGAEKPFTSSEAAEFLERTRRLSRYADRLLAADPALGEELAACLWEPYTAPAMQTFLDERSPGDPGQLASALRQLRRRVLLRVMARDLGGLAPLEEVTGTMTALADLAITRARDAHHAWLAERFGHPIGGETGARQDLLVVGMGKLGGGELNVSSDVDLMFVYPEEGETEGPKRISNHEFFTRLGQRLTGALHDYTPEGFVFRVDLRLRPFGESGPVVVSFPSLEHYLITQGREWERYAWIKARVICGSRGPELERLARPFVFRKYLDFGAYASMRSLHAQIREEVKRRELMDNIKLGPGGIREIEFIAQVFQLIRGGHVPQLRARPTLSVLRHLGGMKLLPEAAVAELVEAYRFLRNLEHRLQYLDDQQTQSLPESAADRALVAEAMGFADWPQLAETLSRHRAAVTRHFEQVFASPQPAPAHSALEALWEERLSAEQASATLAELGYRDAQSICQRLGKFRRGPRYQSLSRASQKVLDALVPAVLVAAARQAHPDTTLEGLLDLLEAVSRRAAYLALLSEYPQALERVAKVASASRWACEYLTRHPIVLDELLDTRELYSAPDWGQAAQQLRQLLDDAEGDTERQMDVLRHFHHAMVFRLLAKDLEGLLPVEILADHLTALADLILSEVLRLAWAGLKGRHREAPRFALIGYGKLGGKELGYASDLDLIFLYQDPDPAAPEVYARLAQRINTWLTSYTPAGVLYDTDLRLRPDGASGLLVSPLEAFAAYQREKAWVWEHQALTRARFVTGDPAVGEGFEAIRKEVLCQRRDLAALKREIIAMRRKMLEAHPNKSGLFDLKHDRGGIIDVEFTVQYLVLGYSHDHPELTANIGNLALLRLAAALSLIPEELAERVREGYRDFRRRQHHLRLNGARYARVPLEEVAEAVAAVGELWRTVFGED